IISSGSVNKVTASATIFANSPSGGDCGATGVVVDEGYNLADDHSCKFNSATSKSGLKPHLGPLRNNGGPTETQSPAIGSPVLDQIPPSATGNGITLCSSTDQRGVPRPKKTNCDIGAVEMERDLATVDKHFSFTFITFGTPVPTITEKGALPQKLTFTDNGDGTATISGKPKTSGTYHLTIKATFGTGPTKYVVKQAFTLTVDSG
ncbi:MAG: choice-of-anchor Q domain-containing protein, partial [Acidimicrobiales bacterium]